MATDTAGEMSSHRRGLTVTTIAAIAGILAALLADVLTGGAATATLGVGVLVVMIVVQFPILQALGIEYEGLSTKDKIYVTFMTFALWFVSWGILLTTSQL